ncbi:hypothetical protein Scep_011271 [Stephania cephalantha]|uniref:Uncharacterized protein n=1 Tax=Stephania cephalantha TaxID=152367 RepID=A0AAP0JD11_9MAGN
MSLILQTPRLTPPPSTNLSSSSSMHSNQLNLLFRTPNFPATKPPPTPIQMRGGPRDYPGGLNKYQWRRVRPLKSKKIRDAGVRREARVYENRRRAELRSAVLELERPWEGFGGKQGKFCSKRSDLGLKLCESVVDSGDSSRPSCSFGEIGNGWESDFETDDDDDVFGGDGVSASNWLSKRSVFGGESYWGDGISGSSNVGEDCRESESEIDGEFESSLKELMVSGEEERIGNVGEVESVEKKDGSRRGRLGNKEEKHVIGSARRGRYRTSIHGGQGRGRVSRKMKLSHSGEVLNFKWDGTYDKSRTNCQ